MSLSPVSVGRPRYACRIRKQLAISFANLCNWKETFFFCFCLGELSNWLGAELERHDGVGCAQRTQHRMDFYESLRVFRVVVLLDVALMSIAFGIGLKRWTIVAMTNNWCAGRTGGGGRHCLLVFFFFLSSYNIGGCSIWLRSIALGQPPCDNCGEWMNSLTSTGNTVFGTDLLVNK